MGFRVHREAEVDGIDEAEHAESAYDLAAQSGRGHASALPGVLGGHHVSGERSR
jgi:ammonium transporter, Amt family